jgi:hypothetical protein
MRAALLFLFLFLFLFLRPPPWSQVLPRGGRPAVFGFGLSRVKSQEPRRFGVLSATLELWCYVARFLGGVFASRAVVVCVCNPSCWCHLVPAISGYCAHGVALII